MIDPAIAPPVREMTTMEDSADRQRAANSILDRAGVARTLVERLLAMRDAAQMEVESPEEIEVIGSEVVEKGQAVTGPPEDVRGGGG